MHRAQYAAAIDRVGVDQVRMPGQPAATLFAVHFITGAVLRIIFDLHQFGMVGLCRFGKRMRLKRAKAPAQRDVHVRAILAAKMDDALVDPQIEQRFPHIRIVKIAECQSGDDRAKRKAGFQCGDGVGHAALSIR